jgi:hypothetical protein
VNIAFFYHTDATDQQRLIALLLDGLNYVSIDNAHTDAGPNDILRALDDGNLPDLVIIHPHHAIPLESPTPIPVIVFSSFLGPGNNDPYSAEWDGPLGLRIGTESFNRCIRKIVIGLTQLGVPPGQYTEASFRRIVLGVLGVKDLPSYRDSGTRSIEPYKPCPPSKDNEPRDPKVTAIAAENRARHRRANRKGIYVFAKDVRNLIQIDDNVLGEMEEALRANGVEQMDDPQTIRFPILEFPDAVGKGLWPGSRALIVDDQHRRGWSTLLSLLLHGSTQHLIEPTLEFHKALHARNLGKSMIAAFSGIGCSREATYQTLIQSKPDTEKLLPFDLAFIDYRLLAEEDQPSFQEITTSGSELIKAIHDIDRSLPVYVFTASQNIGTSRITQTETCRYFQKPDPDASEKANSTAFDECIMSISEDRSWAWARLIHLGIRHLELSTSRGRADSKASGRQVDSALPEDLNKAWKSIKSRECISDVVTSFCKCAGYKVNMAYGKKGTRQLDGLARSAFELLKLFRNTASHRHDSLLDHPLFVVLAVSSRIGIAVPQGDIDREGEFTEILPGICDYPPPLGLADSMKHLRLLLESERLKSDVMAALSSIPSHVQRRARIREEANLRRRYEQLNDNLENLRERGLIQTKSATIKISACLSRVSTPLETNFPMDQSAEISPDLAAALSPLSNDDSRLLNSVVLIGRLLGIARNDIVPKNIGINPDLFASLALACAFIALRSAEESIGKG